MNDARVKLEELLKNLAKAEADVVYAKAALSDFPRHISREISDPAARREIARYMYWFVPEIPAAAIAEHLLHCQVSGIPREVGWLESDLNCDRCGSQLIVRSRAELQEAQRSVDSKKGLQWAEGYRVLCPPCREVVLQERYPNFGNSEKESL